MAQGKEGNYLEFKIMLDSLRSSAAHPSIIKGEEQAPQGGGFKGLTDQH